MLNTSNHPMRNPGIQSTFKKRINRAVLRIGVPLVVGGAVFSLVATGQTTPPNIPPINIASEPLHAATQGDKRLMALALSVEFPTVGAQYNFEANGTIDDSYSSSKEYIGYYNAEMCYVYQDAPGETPSAGKNKVDYKRFVISGKATERRCDDAFSGNFLNWASNSAIDMLRLGLSGGDRIVDEPKLTILQRAVLPNGNPTCMWNSTNFPAKKLALKEASGAVPDAMINAANGKPIWVANTLNRIYFRAGDNAHGTCTDTSGYTLMADTSFAKGSTVGRTGQDLPADAKLCANESAKCNAYPDVKEVWYGDTSAKRWAVTPVRGGFTCNNETFGDPANNIVKKCYVRPYTGDWTPPKSANSLNSDGFFYSRVEVCGEDSGGLLDKRDYRFCKKYPSGHFKPVGVVQEYSDKLRMAAFGYALDQRLSWNNGKNGRFGGVLRVPAKYVGPRTYDKNGTENTPASGNPRAEWNAQTGVFFDNPEGVQSSTNSGTLTASGVINYLNRFGRTNPTEMGVYKKYDPASELYYETLRYLQGLEPSAAAVENLTPAMYDGFPIYTTWKDLDPYGDGRTKDEDYSCLQSNIALIGDVNTHDSRYYGKSRMPAANPAGNIPDMNLWLSVVQNFELANGTNYVDGSGVTRTISNPNGPTSGFAGTLSMNMSNEGNLARGQNSEVIGLAYWAHTHDIRGKDWTAAPDKQRPGLRVTSFFFDVNEFNLESDPAKRRSNNQYYLAAKYGGFFTDGRDSQVYNTQGNPFYDQNGNPDNDVWQDQNKKNGVYVRPNEPGTYFIQSNARGVLKALDDMFRNAAGSGGFSIAGAATSGSSLTNEGLYSYQASYDTGNWTGDLKAFRITSSDMNPSTMVWSAQERLAARIATPNGLAGRKIVIGRRGANPKTAGTWFTQEGIATEGELIVDLSRVSPTSASDGQWKERLNYLRGDKSKEGSPFRIRSSALADIVNSGAKYVGAPGTSGNMAEGRADFVKERAERRGVVYVGANDGMLHAFDAETGDERFAYIPSWMGPKLSALTDNSYDSDHQAYVDATPVIRDAKIGSGTDASDWKTVLIGGTGGGGRGVFALDVTDPTSFDPSKVMWEFTHLNDADMGFVIGKPRVVRLRISGNAEQGNAVYRWFAMVPSGVNNYVEDKVYKNLADYENNNADPRTYDRIFSSTGRPAIFLLALDKPAGQEWKIGENYYKISLPFDTTLATTKGTGIINLEAMTDRQGMGTTEYVFAGDLHGNFWALDFTKYDAKDWTAGNLSKFTTGSNGAYPMYIAKDASGNIQPITAAPTILRVGGADGQHIVGFGTGKYIEPSDATATRQNTYYALYDNNDQKKSSGQPGVVGIDGRNYLQKVVSDEQGNLKPESPFTWGSPKWANSKERAGWYYDLPKLGERVVYDSTYIPLTTKVQFSSLLPNAAGASGVCGVKGGNGDLYTMDLIAGIGQRRLITVGVPGQPLVLFDDESTMTSKADSTGRSLRTRHVVTLQPGSEKLKAEETSKELIAVGRLSWRQINNYRELKQ